MHRFLGKRIKYQKDAPYIPPRNPFQVFFLALSVALSIPMIYGDAWSAVLERVLPERTVILWGVALLIGSVLSLIGLWMPPRRAIFGVVIERSGMILVGGAAAIYAGVVVYESEAVSMVTYAVSMQIAYSAACWWRVYQLTLLFRWSIAHPLPSDNGDVFTWDGRWNEYGYDKGGGDRG